MRPSQPSRQAKVNSRARLDLDHARLDMDHAGLDVDHARLELDHARLDLDREVSQNDRYLLLLVSLARTDCSNYFSIIQISVRHESSNHLKT